MKIKLIVFLSFLVLLNISCKKETVSYVGNNILPDGDKFKVFYAEITIPSFSVKGEANKFRSDEPNKTLLGSYNFNDEYGMSKASFLTQLRLEKESPDFGTNPVVDSVKLYLSLYDSAYYGDNQTNLTIKIKQLNKDIYKDSTYYSTINGEDYTTTNNICDTSISINEINDNLITFNIANSFGDKIINAPTDSLASNDNFIQYIKGLYFTTDSAGSGGAILYVNHLSTNSKLSIYYHNDENDTVNSSFDLLINSYCAVVNEFKHTYGNINFGTPTEYTYIQGMAGVMGEINLSAVKTFADSGKMMINKAELIIPNEEDVINNLASPKKILAERIDTDSTTTLAQTGNLSDDNSYYNVILTGYIDDIIHGVDTNTNMYIYPSENITNAARTKLINNKDGKNIKLKITYTKY